MNTKTGSSRVYLTDRKVSIKKVPDLKGLAAKDAVYLIERTGMVARVKGYGKVVSQSVKAGQEVYQGGVIEIVLEP